MSSKGQHLRRMVMMLSYHEFSLPDGLPDPAETWCSQVWTTATGNCNTTAGLPFELPTRVQNKCFLKEIKVPMVNFSGDVAPSSSSSIRINRPSHAGSVDSESRQVAACRQQLLLSNSSCLRVYLSSSQNALDTAGAMQLLFSRTHESWPSVKNSAPSPGWLAPLSFCHSLSTVYSCSHEQASGPRTLLGQQDRILVCRSPACCAASIMLACTA